MKAKTFAEKEAKVIMTENNNLVILHKASLKKHCINWDLMMVCMI